MRINIGLLLTFLGYYYFFTHFDRNIWILNVDYYIKFSLNLNQVLAPLLIKIAIGVFIFKKILNFAITNYECLHFFGYLRPLEKCELTSEEIFFEYDNQIPEKKYRNDIKFYSSDDVGTGCVDLINRSVHLSQLKDRKNCPMSISTNIHEFFHYKIIFQMGWFSFLCKICRWTYYYVLLKLIYICLFFSNLGLLMLFMNRNSASLYLYSGGFYLVMAGYSLFLLDNFIVSFKEMVTNLLAIRAIYKRNDLTKKEKKSCRNFLLLCETTYFNEFLFHIFIIGFFLIKAHVTFMHN